MFAVDRDKVSLEVIDNIQGVRLLDVDWVTDDRAYKYTRPHVILAGQADDLPPGVDDRRSAEEAEIVSDLRADGVARKARSSFSKAETPSRVAEVGGAPALSVTPDQTATPDTDGAVVEPGSSRIDRSSAGPIKLNTRK
jgi:hypothetical protein